MTGDRGRFNVAAEEGPEIVANLLAQGFVTFPLSTNAVLLAEVFDADGEVTHSFFLARTVDGMGDRVLSDGRPRTGDWKFQSLSISLRFHNDPMSRLHYFHKRIAGYVSAQTYHNVETGNGVYVASQCQVEEKVLLLRVALSGRPSVIFSTIDAAALAN